MKLEGQRRTEAWFKALPVFILLALIALTLGVYRQQTIQKRDAALHYSRTVCFHASRRLEQYIGFHLKMASFFATRWASHEHHDYSRERFTVFSRILIEEVHGCQRVDLLDADGTPRWSQSLAPGKTFEITHSDSAALDAAMKTPTLVILRTRRLDSSGWEFISVHPLKHLDAPIGFILVHFDVGTIVDECLQKKIRSEFNFTITDGDDVIAEHLPDGRWRMEKSSQAGTSRSFPVQDRTWTLTVVPRRNATGALDAVSTWPVLILGFALSLSLAVIVHLLIRRMAMYRRARDRAFEAIMEKERTKSALDESEGRYRSIFNSATDGLIIIDEHDLIIETNPAACEMHGLSGGELEGRPIVDLIEETHRHQYVDFKEQISRFGVGLLASLDVRADCTTFDVEVHGTSFRYQGQNRILAILTDVSERRRSEQRLATLSRKVLVAQEDERSRLSRDLHDELGQMLTALRLELDWLHKSGPLEGEARRSMERSTALVEQAAHELRRICRGLRPPLLDDLGLEPAVRHLVGEFEKRTGTSVDLEIRMDDNKECITSEAALCTYRILQEALTNVTRHSGAREVDVTLSQADDRLTLSVFDDGKGFDHVSLTLTGSGITGMNERANLVGGKLTVRSIVDQGTRVEFTLPLIASIGGVVT